MAGLLVVELLEEIGGKLGVFPDKGVELMVGRGRGVDRQVRVARHWSAVEGTEGIPTEGGVGLAVLEQGLFPGFVTFLSFPSEGGRFKSVVIVEVPHWGREVPEEGR